MDVYKVNIDQIRALGEDIWAERKARLDELSSKAAEVGLKPLTGIDFIWVPQGDDTPQGSLPETFFTYSEDEGEPFIKHAIVFPIRSLGELAIAIAEADVLYSEDANGVVYERHGIGGLVEFLREKGGVSAQKEG